MERFVKIWGCMWEEEKITIVQLWMEKIKEELRNKIRDEQDIQINEETTEKVIKRRMNWTSPGIDGIQNFWWKKFSGTWKAFERAKKSWNEDPEDIPEWVTLGRTVLLTNTEDLSFEKEYRPITCLNTSYKLFTGMIGRYMKDHARQNEICDEGQLGASGGVLGTVDQLLIDNYIMDEVREHKTDLAVAFYDYKNAYDKVHHD